MARITKEDVWRVAKEIDAGGDKPSVIEVRKRLGAGSYTTITTALREWVKPEEDVAVVESIPDDLQTRLEDFGREFYSAVRRVASEEFDAERVLWSSERAELLAQIGEAGRVADLSESTAEELQLQIFELRQDLATALADAKIWESRYNDNLLIVESAKADALVAREECARVLGRFEALEKVVDKYKFQQSRAVKPKLSQKLDLKDEVK